MIEQSLFAVKPGLRNRYSWFWLAIAFFFSLVYSCMALQQAFDGQYVVQDDARQHVFWMRRFLDPELFPNDSIADYFQSVAPLGYKMLYAVPSVLGIDPLVVSKIVPIFLGVVSTYYCFVVVLELLPIPFTSFIATILLNQNLWLQDGLISGTPKAFAVPLLMAFLYYYLQDYLFGLSIAILLIGCFYPSFVFICSGLLLVRLWSTKSNLWQFKFQPFRREYLFCFTGLLVAFLVLLPYAVSTSEFAPTITLEQARSLPDFALDGRSSFFNRNLWNFWFNGSRSGLRVSSALMPPLTYLAIFLPLLLRFKQAFPLSQKVTVNIKVLNHLLLVSLAMFAVAHLLLFKLHLPSRYTQNSFRIIMAIASSVSITIVLQALLSAIINYFANNYYSKKVLSKLVLIVLGMLLIIYPHTVTNFVWTQYERGTAVELYKFLQQQPKDTLVASLTYEADNLPTFAQRSILVSKEYAIPYHTGYYFPFRQKAIDLITASYSNNTALVQNFIRKYKVDFWLIEASGFTPEYIADNSWLMQHQPAAQTAIANLKQSQVPVLQTIQDNCSALTTQQFNLISAECILSVEP